eukprot:763973-Hanusia_phi.AAC.1
MLCFQAFHAYLLSLLTQAQVVESAHSPPALRSLRVVRAPLAPAAFREPSLSRTQQVQDVKLWPWVRLRHLRRSHQRGGGGETESCLRSLLLLQRTEPAGLGGRAGDLDKQHPRRGCRGAAQLAGLMSFLVPLTAQEKHPEDQRERDFGVCHDVRQEGETSDAGPAHVDDGDDYGGGDGDEAHDVYGGDGDDDIRWLWSWRWYLS